MSFRAGGVLSTGWRVWKHNLVPFTLLALLIYSPSSVAHAVLPQENALYVLPLDLFVNTLLSAALTYGVVMELHGTRPSFRDCVFIGLAQLLPAVGVTLLSILGTGLGLVLLVVPGVILMLRWYVAVPVALIEKLGVTASLRRSQQLTEGHKGQLFLISVLFYLLIFGISFMIQDLPPDVLVVVSAAQGALTGSFGAVLAAVSYTMLRHELDGTSVPQIATAFARISER